MKIRSYKITFCLGSGYAGVGKTYTPKFAEKVIEKWMTERLKKGQPVVNGLLSFGTLFFPARGRRKDGSLITVASSAVYTGDLLTAELKDNEVEAVLNSLAEQIKQDLKQDRVYIIYKDKNWFI